MISKYLDFEVSPVFWWNLNSRKEFKVNQGGMWSTKTRSIMQVLAGNRAQLEVPKRILVLGQDVPNLKEGPIEEFEKTLQSSSIISDSLVSYNKSERKGTFKNGSTIKFNAVSDTQDARQGKRDITFINEANGIPYNIVKEIIDRTEEETFIDYNPDEEFWVHDKIIRGKDSDQVDFFISNCFEHNPWTPDSIIRSLLDDKEKDPMRFKIMGLGLSGKVEGLVFKIVNASNYNVPNNDLKKFGYGLDFGYSNDPTALVRCGLYQGKVFGEELIYETGLFNSDIARRMEVLGVDKYSPIYADSADPKSIDELKSYGFNVIAADKGRDSIMFGINLIKQYGPPRLTNSSKNWINEGKKYEWIKKGDETLNKPIDKHNHCWDAARYWAMMSLAGSKNSSLDYDAHF